MVYKKKKWNGKGKGCDDENCTICLGKFKQYDVIRTLPCMHKFHAECIDEWLKKKTACPICRKDFS